ncbi:branched-chain amino acid ABC transporter permease [Pseudonocardia ailaonensis]|uniref:Branched-chain amino acid ABC transporter permease n=1 Tax=Pseudonocardia ailaonensis TaxID=367279 RepID=A0ABN2N2J9_9PSEU
MTETISPPEPGTARGRRRRRIPVPRLPLRFALPLAIVLVAVAPLVFADAYRLRVATAAGLLAILALAMNLLIGGPGEISFAHGGFYGVGAYVLGILTVGNTLSFWPALLVATAAGTAVGVAVGIPALRTRTLSFAIATLGMGLFLANVFGGWTSVTGGSVGLANIPRAPLDGIPVPGSIFVQSGVRQFYLVWLVVLVVLVLNVVVLRGGFGNVLKSIKRSEVLVESLGFRPGFYRLATFAFSAGLAALAGGMYAQYISFVGPDNFTIFTAFNAIVVVAIGGLGNAWGTVATAIVLTVVPEYLHALDDYRVVVFAVLLFVVLRVRAALGWRT